MTFRLTREKVQNAVEEISVTHEPICLAWGLSFDGFIATALNFRCLLKASLLLAKGARLMHGGMFEANPCKMTNEDCAGIFEKS